MANADMTIGPLPGANFGRLVQFPNAADAAAKIAVAEAEQDALLGAFHQSRGLLVVPGMGSINDEPGLLVRLSYLFGPEVEDYHQTLTERGKLHDSVAEILVISNMAPSNQPPPDRPEPPLTEDGNFPVQFPQRRGWHTDQSFRRPPPDVALFYAVMPTPKGQGQTLYADGAGAYEALSPTMKKRIEGLEGYHVAPGTGRSETAVRAGDTPLPLLPHQRAQRQPVVRIHPVTGQPALYLCESGQMDWIVGPLLGMTPGPDGDGAALIKELMNHYTQPQFTYIHDWDQGDIVIYDNRSTIHSATWFDTSAHDRLMWRTTVTGNPGPEYDGEKRSWIPEDGSRPAEGLDDRINLND
jgi:taurine dioxygenase